MAKKKRARKSSTRKKATRKKAGKKRTREWTKVTFEQLDAWREERKIPKKKMAEMLGVTNSTYHNWARGIAVATPNTQERILGVLNETHQGNGASSGGAISPDVMTATGQIVGAYLQSSPSGMTSEALVKLVRDVRRALTN
jgi:transcriptional regulator with XRE-family HTH domain